MGTDTETSFRGSSQSSSHLNERGESSQSSSHLDERGRTQSSSHLDEREERQRSSHLDARVDLGLLRVATAGGTDAARRAGQYTAIWPSSHSTTAPTGR